MRIWRDVVGVTWRSGRSGRLRGWSGVVASTTRTVERSFMCRTSLRDQRRSCRKPHLLPGSSAARGPQPDPNKHRPFFHHKKKKRLKERVSGGAKGGGSEIRSGACCRAGGVGRVGGWGRGGGGAEEGKPQEDYELHVPRFSSTSPFWKPFYRLADASWSSALSAGASCLAPPSRTTSATSAPPSQS